MNKAKNNRVNSLDSMRIIAAFLVVCIHTVGYPGKEIVTLLARIAVPLFLMISGFFLYSHSMTGFEERIRRNIIKTSKLYVVSLCVTCVYALVFCICEDGDLHRIPFGPWMLFVWLTGFSQPMHEVTGFWGGVLWYLQAYIYGLFVIKFSYRNLLRISSRFRIIISLALIILWTFLNNYDSIKFIPFMKLFFLVIPYLVLGLTVSEITSFIISLSNKILMLFGITILFFLFLELKTTGMVEFSYIPDNYFSLPFLVLFVFMICIRNPEYGGKWMAMLGKRYAVWIYIYHGLILLLWGNDHPIVVFGLTFLLVLPIYHLNKKIGWI